MPKETVYNKGQDTTLRKQDEGGWMDKFPQGQNNFRATDEDEGMDEEYEEMELLERLETLREDMEDLGVTTLAEVIQRIEELHRRLDQK